MTDQQTDGPDAATTEPVTTWTPTGETAPRLDEESVIAAICSVYDPEIPVNIYDLGLIYAVEIDGSRVRVEMTLTAPGCPSAQELPEAVHMAVSTVPGVTDVEVEVVWDPPWDPSRMSEEAQLALNIL